MNLTGEKFKDVYKAFLTLSDNVGLTNVLKRVSDGFGVESPIYVSDSKVAIDSPMAVGTTTINASAQFQIDSTSKGFLMPRMRASEAEAISTPAEALLIYVNDTSDVFTSKGWYGYNGSSWEKLNN
jgi:hypothetical protein